MVLMGVVSQVILLYSVTSISSIFRTSIITIQKEGHLNHEGKPVLAWEESIARYPEMDLPAADGNHSNLKGALLSAYVFYHVITGQSAADLPNVQSINVDADTQKKLREVAADVVENNQETCVVTEDVSDPRMPTLGQGGLLGMAMLVAVLGGAVLRR